MRKGDVTYSWRVKNLGSIIGVFVRIKSGSSYRGFSPVKFQYYEETNVFKNKLNKF